MATYVWVGGTATWDTTTTSVWLPAGVPTAADSVIFSSATTYTVTMTGALACLDFTVSAGTVTFATGTAPTLAISGSMSVIAGTVWTSTGAITFKATTTGKTISTNGVNLGPPIYFDGVGGGWTLNSAFSTSNNFIYIVNGSFSTGSNYTLTTFGIQSSGTATRSISLNASTVNLGDINLNATGLTWNAGTSSIVNNYGGSVYLNGAGQTFYDYSATGTFYSLPITGANTFHNLSFPAWIQNGKQVSFDSNITVTGTLTCPVSGTIVGGYRNFLASATIGTPITITAAAVSLTDVDFRDIVGAGAASWSGTRLGDCGGNSGITFPAAKTVYMVGTTQTNFQAALFSTTSGGSTSTANFPLPQDTAIINNSSISSGQTLTLFAAQYGNLDFSGLTNTITLSTSSVTGTIGFYGNFTGSSSITSGATAYGINFQNRTTKTFTSAGVTFNCPFTINTVAASSLQLLDNVTTTTTTALTQGTLDLNGKKLTSTTFNGNNANTKSISFGTGDITVNGTGLSLFVINGTGFTYTGTPTVNISNNSATASSVTFSNGTESTALNFNITTGTYILTFVGSGSCKSVNFTGFTGSLVNSTRTIYGNLTLVSGMTVSSGGNTNTFAATSGTQQITTASQTLDFPLTVNGSGGTVQLQDALTMGSTKQFNHSNGILDLNGKTLTVGSNYNTQTGTKNLTFNGGTLVCPAVTTTAFNNAAPTNYTTTAGAGGNGTISLTGATAKTFVGGGSTYAATLNQGGAGTLTISGSNTLAGISNSYSATGATTISFTSSTTQTVSSFTATGTAGNVLTLNAVTSGTFASLALSSGIVSGIDYLSVRDLHVTPATTTWYAGANSTNVSGNTGWIFTAAPSGTATLSFAVTDPPDSASMQVSLTASAALSATDPPDVVAVAVSLVASAALAATDAPDTVSIAARGSALLSLAATDAPDVVAIAATIPVVLSLAATDAQDVAAIAVSAYNNAALAATDAPDTVAVTTVVTNNLALSATDAKDVAAVSASVYTVLAASTTSSSSTSCSAVVTYSGAATTSSVSTGNGVAVMIYSGISSTNSVSFASVFGRYLWEPETPDSATWEPRVPDDTTWVDRPPTSVTWTEAA